MNTADLARLELAKRAYKATQANEAEVQTGVRRARLALTRPKRRRTWFSKGLVFVVLAVGSLAYAKPNALGEIVEKVLPREDAAGKHGGGRFATLAAPVEATTKLGHAKLDLQALQLAPKHEAAGPGALETPAATQADNGSAQSNASRSAASTKKPAASADAARPNTTLTAALAASAADADSRAKPPTSDWGRVGQALASGNDTEALAALGELAASDDDRTRDKADLGRAQLLMAHGETTQACSLARSLTHRRAGSRIERQAQILLKSCR